MPLLLMSARCRCGRLSQDEVDGDSRAVCGFGCSSRAPPSVLYQQQRRQAAYVTAAVLLVPCACAAVLCCRPWTS